MSKVAETWQEWRDRMRYEASRLTLSAMIDRTHVLGLILIGTRPEKFELFNAFWCFITSVWWFAHPHRMDASPAFKGLAGYHPQWMWATKMIFSAVAQVAAVMVRWWWLRLLVASWVAWLWAYIALEISDTAPAYCFSLRLLAASEQG